MTRRYLDKNFDIILKPEKRQIKLDKFCTDDSYAHLLKGKDIIDVYTHDKKQLEGTLTVKAHDRVVFNCLTPGMPNIEVGSLLLLIVQKVPQLLLIQATVETVVDTYVMLAPIDPRRKSRFRTRIAATLYGIPQPMFEHIKSHSARVFREDEVMRPMSGPSYISRAVDKVEDHAKVPHDGTHFVGKGRAPIRCILADISEGGCCLYVSRDSKIDGLNENKLIFVMLEFPHLTKTIQARVFASVRQIRQESDYLVLHCMFIEAMPESHMKF